MLTANILQIRDESAAGLVFYEMQLQFESETVTIKEIIEQRVKDEVAKYNQNSLQDSNGLVTPSIKERVLNKTTIKNHKVDSDKQTAIALKAFKNNGFFMLVDDYQVDSLDDVVRITKKTVISFIKLTQLVGG